MLPKILEGPTLSTVIEKDIPVIYLLDYMGELFAGPGFRACSHAACKGSAVATLSFDYASRQVWLAELPPVASPSSYDLCDMHVRRFSAPLGWDVDDRRDPVLVVHGERTPPQSVPSLPDEDPPGPSVLIESSQPEEALAWVLPDI
ncbi:MAG: DUF3499 family protein [Actinomycetota bacterium]